MITARISRVLSIAFLVPLVASAQTGGGGGGLCSPTTPLRYKAVEIGTEYSASAIIAGASVNDLGHVTGTYSNGTKSNPFYYNGVRTSLLPSFAGNQGSGLGINNSPLIVGHSDAKGGIRRAFKVNPGQNLIALPLAAGGKSNQAHGVNRQGVISGCSEGEFRDPYTGFPIRGNFAVIWRTSGLTVLDSRQDPMFQTTACAADISDSGAAAGYVRGNYYGTVAAYWNSSGARTNIGTFSGGEMLGSDARALNGTGVVVGRSSAESMSWGYGGWQLVYVDRAFKWSNAEGLQSISSPGQCSGDICYGADASSAFDISDDNQIVGYFRIYGRDFASIYHPQYESSLYFKSLEPLVTNLSGLGNPRLLRAVSINKNGQILVNGVKPNGSSRSYLLTRDCGGIE